MTAPATPKEQLINSNTELDEITRIMNLKDLLRSEYDVLEACRPKVRKLVDDLRQAIDAKGDTAAPITAFVKWKGGDGRELWEKCKEIKAKYPDRTVTRPTAAPAGPIAWSATCDTVWADMHTRFDDWKSGAATNRGHWWNGPANGGPGGGATKVPDTVVEELRRRIGERPGNILPASWWTFQDSLSGGLAFHRTSHNVDFIYHLTL